MEIKDLKLGMKLEVAVIDNYGKKQGPYYPVKLQHINDNNTIEVDMPMLCGQIILFKNESLLQVVMTFKDGIYSFNAKVLGKNVRNNISLMVLKQQDKIIKIQRRAHYRMDCSCMVRYRPFDFENPGISEKPFEVANTIDLSGGGMSLITQEKIKDTNLLECVIILEKDISINIIGEIVKTEKKEDNNFEKWKICIKFKRIAEKDRERIITYIFQEQLRLKRKGLI